MSSRRVYLLSHHHLAGALVAKFLEESVRGDTLLCRDNVVEFYRRFAKQGTLVQTFRFPRRLKFVPFHIIAQAPLKLFRPRVELVCTSPMGLQVLIAMSRFRIANLIYVDLADEFPAVSVKPPNLLWRFYLAVLSILLGRRVRLSEWGGVVEFSVTGGSFEPPKNRVPVTERVLHEYDLVVLDFAVASLPIDEVASRERIREFIGRFRSAAVKKHPNHPGDAARWLSLPEIPAYIPAEALADDDVHCLSLFSSAAKAFKDLTILLQLLVFASPSDEVEYRAKVREQFAAHGDLNTFDRGMRTVHLGFTPSETVATE